MNYSHYVIITFKEPLNRSLKKETLSLASLLISLPAWTPSIHRLFRNIVRHWHRKHNTVEILRYGVNVIPIFLSQAIRQNFFLERSDLLLTDNVKCRLAKIAPQNV